MHSFMLLGIFDWLVDFFKELFNLIPKIIYLLYASLACILDVFQLALRKLAGLDVYYDSQGNAISGDIVTNFISGILGIHFDGNTKGFDYSTLSTVFWSFVLFGVIIAFVAVFVAIIKSHYNYDEKAAKGPMQHVYAGLKAILNIAVVPIVVILGLYVSQALLTAVDSITSAQGASIANLNAENKLQGTVTKRGSANNSTNAGEKTYIYYDFWGVESAVRYTAFSHGDVSWDDKDLAKIASTTQTFSGSLFIAAAYSGNRARNGQITIGNTSIFGLNEEVGIFKGAKNPAELANLIDTAFACNIHLAKDPANIEVNYSTASEWAKTGLGINIFYVYKIPAFSKFNIGAVWYYYDLWQFNFIVGFGALVVCVSLFINIILGLMTRIFMCLGLFLIAPPLFGLRPIDGGEASKSWTENFMKQVLMAYGSILGMNIFFLIFPLINQIKLFDIDIVDYFMTTLFIIVGLISIKAFISVVSGLVGGEDANKTGEGMKEQVGQTVGKAVNMTKGAAKFTAGAFTMAVGGAKAAVQGVRAGYNAAAAKKRDKEADELQGQIEEARERGDDKTAQQLERQQEALRANAQYNRDKSKALVKSAGGGLKLAAGGAAFARKSALSVAKDTFMGDKGLSAFWGTVHKKDSPEERSAKALEKLAGTDVKSFETPWGGKIGPQNEEAGGLRGFAAKVQNKVLGTRAGTPGQVQQMQGQLSGLQDSMNQVAGYDTQDASGSTVHHAGQLETLNNSVNTQGSNITGAVNANTAATQQGFADMGGRIDAGTAATQSVGRKVSATTGAVTRARHAVEQVRSDTQEIAADTATAHKQLKQINVDMLKAERDRADALAAQELIMDEVAEIKRKADEIAKKGPKKK